MVSATMHMLLKLKGKRYKNDAAHHCCTICGVVISLIFHAVLILYENETIMDGNGKLQDIGFKLKQYTREWVDRVCGDALTGEHYQKDWDRSRAIFELEVQ